MDGEHSGPVVDNDVLRQMAEHAPVALVALDRDGRVRVANRQARALIGPGIDGTRLVDLFEGRDRLAIEPFLDDLRAGVLEPDPEVTAALLPAGRARRTVRLVGRCCASGPGDAGGVVALLPVSRRGRRRSAAAADVDPLTGLPDRSRFLLALDRACRKPAPGGAVAVIDLHRFRMLNGGHGRDTGDAILRQVAQRLAAQAPPGALVARIGGDEFGVLLPTGSVDDAIAEVRVLLGALSRPLAVDTGELVVDASAGVASTGVGSGDLALRQADAAVHEAKKLGPRRVVAYGPTVARWAENLWDLAATVARLEQDRSRLERESRTDALTGLPNVRALGEAMRSVARSDSEVSEPLSILFVDLDHFGAFNKHRGDAAGDIALRRVAAAVAAACRAGDSAYRKGGEELVVLLPRTAHQDALVVAERIRSAVEELRIAHGGHPDHPILTVTVGVATARPDQSVDAVQAAAADAALRSKLRDGRNRTVSAPV